MIFPSGYSTEPGFDPAEDHIGPFYYKEMGDTRLYAFKVEDRHCNVTAILHGGVLMTFADYCLSMEATNNYKEEDCVTISFSCEFVSGAAKGDLVECRASVTRKTGSLAFIVGEIFVGDATIFTFSSVVKRLKRDR
jgi:acyl-coenzyme A thioesterase PaaI-like protein